MNIEPRQPDNPRGKLFWLLVAFLPSALGLVFLVFTKTSGIIPPLLLVLDLGLSIFAAGALTRGIKNVMARACVAFLLFCFFLVSNLYLVAFEGCSGR